MCNSIAQGGRRCPIHRNDSVMVLQNIDCDLLNRGQKEKVFAALRAEGANTPAPTMEEWKENVLNHYVYELSEESAAEERAYFENPANLPDGKTYYALTQMHSKINSYNSALNAEFTRIAQERGVSVREIAQEFKDHANSVDLTRGAPVPETFTRANRLRQSTNNLPADRSSVHALVTLQNSQTNTRSRIFETVSIDAQLSDATGTVQYDSTDGYMRFISRYPESTVTTNYINVPEEYFNRINNASSYDDMRMAYLNMRNNAENIHFANEQEATYAAALRRCESCGQFAALNHSCPERVAREEISESTSDTNVIREALEDTVNASIGFNAVETSDNVVVDNIPYEDSDSDLLVRENNVEDYVPHAPRGLEAYPFVDDSPNHLVTVTQTADTQRFPTKLPIDSSQDITHSFDAKLKRVNSNAYMLNQDSYAYLPNNIKTALVSIYENNENATIVFKSNSVPTDNSVAENIEIVQTYNADKYITKVVNSGGDNNGSATILYRRLMHPVPNLRFTEEEATSFNTSIMEAIRESASNRLNTSNMINAQGIFDANLDAQPRVSHNLDANKVASIVEGKSVAFNIKTILPSGTMRRYDDQGYRYGSSSSESTVEGMVLVKKDEDGLIKVYNNERSLKCSCDDYQRNYYCAHIHYVNRHAGNTAQQAIPVAEAPALLLNSGGNGITLADRGDSRILRNENGEEYFKFKGTPNLRGLGSTAGELRGSVSQENFSSSHIAPSATALLTDEQVVALENEVRLANSVSRIWTPIDMHNGVSVALATGKPVDMPVAYTIGEKNVDGRVTIVENDGEIKYLSRNLRCECADYRANYRCEHIDFSLNHPTMFAYNLTSNVVNNENQLNAMSRSNTERIERENTIRRHMENHSFTRERAIEYIEELRVSAEARAREERLNIRRRVERDVARQAADWERNSRSYGANRAEFNTYRENLLERWNDIEPNAFLQNREAFYDIYRAERNDRTSTEGRLLLPYRTENVLDGAGSGVGSRRFGVELELIADYDQLRQIGRDLHSEGFTESARQSGYHSAARNGWARWSFEDDGTVDGEIVSPILDDSQESWEQIRAITDIVNRNGATVNTSTGSHVHISSGSYLNSTAKHAELIRFSQRNEDMLYRMSSNPRTGRHRGTSWCQPNALDSYETINGDLNLGHRVLGHHTSHGIALNMESAATPQLTSNHIEFRTWDGTLDPSIIQAQVMMSAAMTDYAERTIMQTDRSERPAENQLLGRGWHRQQRLTGTNSSQNAHGSLESFTAETDNAARFIDHLFRREADREVMARLFARTNWQA